VAYHPDRYSSGDSSSHQTPDDYTPEIVKDPSGNSSLLKGFSPSFSEIPNWLLPVKDPKTNHTMFALDLVLVLRLFKW
jgi:hypothetical protein